MSKVCDLAQRAVVDPCSWTNLRIMALVDELRSDSGPFLGGGIDFQVVATGIHQALQEFAESFRISLSALSVYLLEFSLQVFRWL